MTGGHIIAETTPSLIGSILDTTNAQIVSLCPSDPDGNGNFRKDRDEDDGNGNGDGGGHHSSSSSTTTTTATSTSSNTASCSILPSSAITSAVGTTGSTGAQGTGITGNEGVNASQMHSKGISGGSIAGIIIGLLALIALSVSFFFILRGRYLRQKDEADRLSREEKEVPPIPNELAEVHDRKADVGQGSFQLPSTSSGAGPSRVTHPRGALSLSSSSPSSEMSEFQYATLTYSSLQIQRSEHKTEIPGPSVEPSLTAPSRVRTPETDSSLHGDMLVHQKTLQDQYHSLGRGLSSTDAVSRSGSGSAAGMDNLEVPYIDELPPPEYKE